jgi:hypothetical protein
VTYEKFPLFEIHFARLHINFKIKKLCLQLKHVNGVLFKLVPSATFSGLGAGQSLQLTFNIADPTVSRTDSMPNWYVAQTNCSDPTLAKTIKSTSGETLSFVEPFVRVEQLKRQADDQYNPYTPQYR